MEEKTNIPLLVIKVQNIKNDEYSPQLRVRIFVKLYGFLSFAN